LCARRKPCGWRLTPSVPSSCRFISPRLPATSLRSRLGTALHKLQTESDQAWSIVGFGNSRVLRAARELPVAVALERTGRRKAFRCARFQQSGNRINREDAKRSEVHRAPDRKARRAAREKGATDKNVFVQIGVSQSPRPAGSGADNQPRKRKSFDVSFQRDFGPLLIL
jgi:hypothetical protein